MKVITVGSSAGGYISILVGILLNADMIFTFSPILKLNNFGVNPKCSYKVKYDDLTKLIQNTESFILYFTPEYSKNDIEQLSLLDDCKKDNLVIYKYKSDIHGGAMKRKGMKGLINSSKTFLSFADKYFFKGRPHKHLMQLIFGFRYLWYLLIG